MNEDEIVNALIRFHREREKTSREMGDVDGDVDIFPEAHYNHYGNRGVVDLYTLTGGWEGTVYEVKSEFAVRDATGANEIVRQFNRMREFFPAGSSYPMPTTQLDFELCFTPTEYNANHLIENADVYSEVAKTDISKTIDIDTASRICFRLPDPDNITPILMFSKNFDFRDRIQRGVFIDYVESNPELFARISDAFESFSDR